MPTVSVNLPVPAGNGVGATVNIAALGKNKMLVLTGSIDATVILETSGGGGTFCQVLAAQGGGAYPIEIAADAARIRIQGYKVGSIAAELAGDDSGAVSLALPVPAATGVGAAVDISTLGSFLTAYAAITGGNFAGALSVELGDGSGEWAQAFPTFQGGGCFSAIRSATFARVRRLSSSPLTPGVPTVHLSGSPLGGGGGGISVPIHYWIGGRESYASVTPLSVGAIRLDPDVLGSFSELRFAVVGARGSDHLDAIVELYNLTTAASVATLTFTTTAPTYQESADLFGTLPSGNNIYEARIYLDNAMPPDFGDSVELYSAFMIGTP